MGRFSPDQLAPLCALATPDTDAHWAEHGPALEPSQLAARAAKTTRKRREAGQEQEAKRTLSMWNARGGGVRGSFYLPDTDAETLAAGLDRLAGTYTPTPCTPRIRERLIPDPPTPEPEPDDDTDDEDTDDARTTRCRQARLQAIRARLRREALRDLACQAP